MHIRNRLQLEPRALHDRQRLRWFAMNKLRTELDLPGVKVSINSAADSLARFKHDDVAARCTQLARCRQSSRARSYNYDVDIFCHRSIQSSV